MNQDHQRILKNNYYLTTNEAHIYLAMVDTGYVSILKLSQATEIKRSTLYLGMEGLIEKGLAKVIIKGKKRMFLPKNPESMLSSLENKRQELEKIVPLLKDNYLRKTDRPIINFYEGKKAIRNVYKEALSSQKETLWYGSARDMKDEFPEYYNQQINIRKINDDFNGMRDIVNDTKTDRKYAKIQNSKKDPSLEVRMVPKDMFLPDADNIIYDNKLAILSIKRDFFATVIENPTIVNAYRCMFELSWKSARNVK